MKNNTLKELIGSLDVLEWYKPATDDQISDIENKLKIKIPNQYKELLLLSNGVYCDHFRFIGTEEMIDMQNIIKNIPNYLIIGEDGGGMLAIVKLDSTENSVYCTHGSFVDESDFEIMATNIKEWMQQKSPFCVGYHD